MYYPKNKIKTNLYTNGDEFVVQGTNTSYVGYYHALYNGKYYTGKTPSDSPVRELTKNIVASTPNTPSKELTVLDYDNYNRIKNIDSSIKKLLPLPYYPKPKNEDYKLGEITRYFVKKINELIYIEINKDEYESIKNKDSKYAYEYFLPFVLSWQIYGNRVDIIQINYNNTILLEQKLNIKGLQNYLDNKYDELYKYPVINNLKTLGDELQFSNSNRYIGDYHIDEYRGFVEGNTPTNTSGIQNTLFPINKNIEKQLLDSALKKTGQFIYPTPIYDIIKGK